MAAPAESGSNGRDVNVIGGGTRHQADSFPRLRQHEERIRLEQVAQFVRQAGDFFGQVLRFAAGQHHAVTVDFVRFGGSHQPVVEFALFRAERRVEKADGQAQIGALLQQPGHRARIAGGGAGVGERTGILVNPQQEQRGLQRREERTAFVQGFHQKGGGGAQIEDGHFPLRRRIPRSVCKSKHYKAYSSKNVTPPITALAEVALFVMRICSKSPALYEYVLTTLENVPDGLFAGIVTEIPVDDIVV